MDNSNPNSGWNEWSKHILIELDDNKKDHKEISRMLSGIKRDIAVLKVKSGIWGAIAGAIPVIIFTVFWLLSKAG